ncbi:hypothetical protein [Bradyrhizobium sp.]|uniref:hypothetical protein n=1 Tax=Bradyrhizobium sp. TaxID=376 RepID=UPI004037C999
MSVTTMPESAAANDVLTARADERLAHAYEQIASADEQLARLTEQLARMEQDAARQPSMNLRRRPSRGGPALRGLVGLLAAACIAGAAFVAQSSYGEAARPAVAQWVSPYIGSISWLAPAQSEVPAQPGASSVQLASVDAAPPQATRSAQTRPQEAAAPTGALPTGALDSAGLTQLLQTMARDLTAVQQGIDQLKANQEKLAGDNARTAEQLMASQEQMTRLIAKVSEQEQRAARTVAPSPRPIAEPARKPAAAQASSQARAQPLQLQPAQR